MSSSLPAASAAIIQPVIDLVAELKQQVTKDQVNDALRKAAEGELNGVLQCIDEPLVSCDFNGSSYSSSVDCALTTVMDGNFVKVLSWYDNEWGFSKRMVDVTKLVGSNL